jgi:GNAT superfamily N-acetyltransferase
MGIIRKINSSETNRIIEHFLRLDNADRRMRFCSVVSDTFVRDYVTKLDCSKALIFGYLEGRTVRALGELILVDYNGTNAKAAEAAFSVEQAWRNEGLGHLLVDRVMTAAKTLRLHTVHLFMLSENIPMRRVATNWKSVVHFEDGEVHAIVSMASNLSGINIYGPSPFAGTALDIRHHRHPDPQLSTSKPLRILNPKS